MIRRPLATTACIAGLVIAPISGLTRPAAAQLTVYDPANYVQNVLTAARTLQQVNQQIQALQNQATMLQNMARQLKSLDYSSLSAITTAMKRIDTLMAQAQGMSFELSSTTALLATAFPASLSVDASTSQRVADAQAQAKLAMDAYRQALKVQAQVVENVQSDGDLITTLVNQSQGATGQLQAQQAANQLQALAVRQDQQLQTLIAAQYRADALERARQSQVLEAGKLATKSFIGSSKAYTPQ
ncbi:MAG: P-type conjugative transfer protein TrbJ [Caulobacter sp.]